MQLQKKTVWVTGASSGIGAALAVELSRRGARVILSARNEERLREVRLSLEGDVEHMVVPLDLASGESIERAAATVKAQVGCVDVLVNNGGISQRSRATETDLSVVRRIMDVNYMGTVALTQAVLPGMMERGWGRIVVTSSLVGKFGSPLRSAYAASKHALHGYFDSLRAEIWGSGVGVTLICPGFIRTDVSLNALTGDGSAQCTMDNATSGGLPAARCAVGIARAIEKGKDEVIIAGKEGLAVYLKRFWPWLFNRLIRSADVT